MKPIVVIKGPQDAGPGEREQMLERARGALDQLGADSVTRIDVPAKGTGSDEGEGGVLRGAVEGIVPALQSGSLFGGTPGLLVVDAHQFLKAEAEIVADLVATLPPGAVAVFVAAGSIPAPLGKVLARSGDAIEVRKMRERDSHEWLAAAARDRRVRIDAGARDALVQRFGTDTAALSRALDQLAASGEDITAETVQVRFSNRPDEPIWLYGDALAAGDVGEALRRLSDFLTHGHPLQLLAFVEGEVRRQSLAAIAPDIDTLAGWAGAKSVTYPIKKVWERRHRVQPGSLRLALDAVARADLKLKSAPEVTHRVTLERLTVALCRWYSGR